MGFLRRWGSALNRIAKTVGRLPKSRRQVPVKPSETAAVRARKILATIRRGEYEFSSQELSDIIKRRNWLGGWQGWFESLEAAAGQRLILRLAIPGLGKVVLTILVADLWHDHRVSSLDFRLAGLELPAVRWQILQRIFGHLLLTVLYQTVRWNGAWRYGNFRFVVPVGRTLRLYYEGPVTKSPLLSSINVIGVRLETNSVVFYTFRRPAWQSEHRPEGIGLEEAQASTAWNRLTVVISWLVLGAYAFVLVHVTLPVLDGAFRLMPQGAPAVHVWILQQAYNLLVILLSYFFLRITMLPLYLKWNKSREELATLISLEARDHEYLRPLTELALKMQGNGLPKSDSEFLPMRPNVPAGMILQMIELMGDIREKSRQRLLGLSRMRRSWIQDLVVGYLFIFSLEWMYYSGRLTPLSVSIQWVNRIMTDLLLQQ